MNRSGLSTHLQPSWLSWTNAGEVSRVAHWLGACHLFVLVVRGRSSNRWIHDGREVAFEAAAGAACYFPADGDHHTVCSTLDPRNELFCLCVPGRHLADLAEADGLEAPLEFRTLLAIEDPEVRRSLAALASPRATSRGSFGVRPA